MKPNWIIELAKTAKEDDVELTPDLLERIVSKMTVEEFVETCYDGSMEDFLQDNPGADDAMKSWLEEFWGAGKASLNPEQKANMIDYATDNGLVSEESDDEVEPSEPVSGRAPLPGDSAEASKVEKLPKKAEDVGRPNTKRSDGKTGSYTLEVDVESPLDENSVAGIFNYADYGPDVEVWAVAIHENLAGPKKDKAAPEAEPEV